MTKLDALPTVVRPFAPICPVQLLSLLVLTRQQLPDVQPEPEPALVGRAVEARHILLEAETLVDVALDLVPSLTRHDDDRAEGGCGAAAEEGKTQGCPRQQQAGKAQTSR